MPAGFKVISSPVDRGFSTLRVSSLTASIGDLLERTAGTTTWAKVTSTSDFFTRKAILMEALSSASSALALELYGDELVEVQSGSNTSITHDGDRMAATDENTVNNSGSDVTGQAVVFVQTGIVGIDTDKRIVGRVLVGNGVDPDAA